ncbi:MAG: DNA adenine methylase, partial [Chloroflexota bacterium]
PRHDCYVEPFGGAANVLLRKSPATHEVWNDLNNDVVVFFQCLRERPADLINSIHLTPYSRREHSLAWEPTDNPLEQARRFYVRSWQSFGSPTYSKSTDSGWRFRKTDSRGSSAIKSFYDTDRLWSVAGRLRSVQIECDDALKVIQRYDTPNTLHYVDPPYVHSTRAKSTGYSNEMTEDHHNQLANLLQEMEGYVLLSGYDSDLYRELYSGWHMVSTSARDIQNNQQKECLWLSPRTSAIEVLPLFNLANNPSEE